MWLSKQQTCSTNMIEKYDKVDQQQWLYMTNCLNKYYQYKMILKMSLKYNQTRNCSTKATKYVQDNIIWFNFLNISSVFGIIFGFACGLGYRYRLYDDSHSGGLLWSKGTSLVVAAASILGLGGYSLFAALCSSKSDCTEIHPYVVFVPVSIPNHYFDVFLL